MSKSSSTKGYVEYVQRNYIDPHIEKKPAALDLDESKLNVQEVLLFIEHSSKPLYQAQVMLEKNLDPKMGLAQLTRKFRPLAQRGIDGYKATTREQTFRVSLDDICDQLARDYLKGHRRDGSG